MKQHLQTTLLEFCISLILTALISVNTDTAETMISETNGDSIVNTLDLVIVANAFSG